MTRRFRTVDGDGTVNDDGRATIRYLLPGDTGANWMVDVPESTVRSWPGFEWDDDGPEAA